MTNVLSLISSSPISINALGKAAGLSQTALTLALVGLGGQIAVSDDGTGIVLAAAPVKAARASAKTGPRGPIARLAPRHNTVRDALFAAVATGPVTVKALCEIVTPLGARYADVLYVARAEMARGTIVETKNGRKCTWSLPAGVESVAEVSDMAAFADVFDTAGVADEVLVAADEASVFFVEEDNSAF